MIRFRENWDYRRLDFAYPCEAIEAVFAVEKDFILRGVATRSMSSGPLGVSIGRVSTKLSHRTMLVDSAYADEFVTALEKACEPFSAAEEEFGNYGQEPDEEESDFIA